MKTFIQIGTNDGNDDFNKQCYGLSEKSKIILVEPQKSLIEKIQKNYEFISNSHDVIIINKAIVPHENIKTIELYFHESLTVLSSVINRKSFGLNSKINVDTITINSLLDELNINFVDELHIDTEGLDYEILLSLDIENNNINLITCEVWPYDEDDKNNLYRTGPLLLDMINQKYSDYNILETVIGGMKSLKFEKK